MKSSQTEDTVLILDRYYHSNMVYGKANGLNKKWLESLDSGLSKADLVILLDITQKESFNRQKTHRDKFEKNKEFLDNISKIYRVTAKQKRWITNQCVAVKGTDSGSWSYEIGRSKQMLMTYILFSTLNYNIIDHIFYKRVVSSLYVNLRSHYMPRAYNMPYLFCITCDECVADSLCDWCIAPSVTLKEHHGKMLCV